jgi:hypothetical protein
MMNKTNEKKMKQCTSFPSRYSVADSIVLPIHASVARGKGGALRKSRQ